jgi:hypothetical protein
LFMLEASAYQEFKATHILSMLMLCLYDLTHQNKRQCSIR